MNGEPLDLQAIGADTIAEYAPDEDFAGEAVAACWDPHLPHPADIDEGPVQARWSLAGVMSVRGAR
jgi:hypothetical protein